MNENNLFFNIGNILKIDGAEYSVQGYIEFSNESDDCKWREYKLTEVQSNQIKWLSIDQTDEKYAIYSEAKFRNSFREENLLAEGYKQVGCGTAKVTDYRGDIDARVDEYVDYKEFEDFNQCNTVAVEVWGVETEYSTGYYLQKENIQKVIGTTQNQHKTENFEGKYNSGTSITSFLASNIGKLCISAAVGLIIILIFSFIGSKDKNEISDYIDSCSDFSCSTKVNSDGENSEKASVYSTSLSVELAAKNIIDGIDGEVADVQENIEDSSVAILTKDEYCLVYSDEAGQTLAQVSTRLYAYSSNQSPYHSMPSAARYFRSFYYSRGYSSDSGRYSSNKNAYSAYNDGTVNSNSSDKYKTYSDSAKTRSKSSQSTSGSSSVRQGSTSSRTSSGGGTSFGK